MAITPAQRLQRQGHLGSSDLPILMGCSPYSRTPNDVYWSKVAPLEEDDTTEAMQIGNYMEGVLVQFAADQLGQEVLHENEDDLYHVAKDGLGKGLFAANLDGLLVDRSAAVECKYCNAEYAQGYGDEGSDEVPDHVLVQCQHQMYCAGLNRVYVAAAMAGYSLALRLFHVDRDEELIHMIVDCGVKWWERHIATQTPPEDVPPMYVLKSKARFSGKTVTLDADIITLLDRRDKLKGMGKEAETEVEHINAKIIDAMGDAEIGHLPDGRLLTYQEYSRTQFDRKRLERERPEIAANYVTKSHYRTLYVKAATKKSA